MAEEQCFQYTESILENKDIIRFCNILAEEIGEDYATKYCKTGRCIRCSVLNRHYSQDQIQLLIKDSNKLTHSPLEQAVAQDNVEFSRSAEIAVPKEFLAQSPAK